MIKSQLHKLLSLFLLFQFSAFKNALSQQHKRPRILVTTDIGGTDPDDNQSMIHLLMYSDLFEIEGLVSTSFVKGRKKDILDMIDFYEKDFPLLKANASGMAAPQQLRELCKQGAIAAAPYKGYAASTEGSEWIIKIAKKKSSQPLWVLVWGGLEDVAQALHDAPEIKSRLRVYWIGGPNKKWGVNAYAYLASHHPDLWMIEANATYRGWFMDALSPDSQKGQSFFEKFIKGRGAMGRDFVNYYKGSLKMGDTPSLAYLMEGNPQDPTGESWGGSFEKIKRSSCSVFYNGATLKDTVATYAVLEWRFSGPEKNISPDSACFFLEVNGQQWPGYQIGKGRYAVRYAPKQAETASYITRSSIPELNQLRGQYVSVAPWPGKPGKDDYKLGNHWYSDRSNPDLFLEGQQGARTIAKHREAFLMDWAKRWAWLAE